MQSLKRRAVSALIGAAMLASLTGLTACGGGGGGGSAGDGDGGDRPPTGDTLTYAPSRWASIAATAFATYGQLSPMEEARLYAMAFAAAHDALNATSRQYAPYLTDIRATDADRETAVGAAVYTVLSGQLGSAGQTYLDDAYRRALLDASAGEAAKQRGVELGRTAAREILAARAADGAADAQGPYAEAPAFGVYQPTPPDAARFVNWGRVAPFSRAIPGFPAALRPYPPYPPLHFYSYDDYNEVRMFGGFASTSRGTERTEIARFWRGSIPSEMMHIGASTARSRGMLDQEQARMLALLAIAMADACVAAFDTKYFYKYWRPHDAIHAFDTNDPNTPGDPDWTPLITPMPSDPEYVSVSAAAAGAAEAVLRDAYLTDTFAFSHSSASLPGVTRSYRDFGQMAQEVVDAGVYSGHHFRIGVLQGRSQGLAVGDAVVNTLLKPAR